MNRSKLSIVLGFFIAIIGLICFVFDLCVWPGVLGILCVSFGLVFYRKWAIGKEAIEAAKKTGRKKEIAAAWGKVLWNTVGYMLRTLFVISAVAIALLFFKYLPDKSNEFIAAAGIRACWFFAIDALSIFALWFVILIVAAVDVFWTWLKV